MLDFSLLLLDLDTINNEVKHNILLLPQKKLANPNSSKTPTSQSLTSLVKDVESFRFGVGYNIQIHAIGFWLLLLF